MRKPVLFPFNPSIIKSNPTLQLKRLISTIFSLISFPILLFSQPVLEWVKQTPSGSDDLGFISLIGNDNNLYVAGRFSGTADFDGGPGVLPFQSGSSTSMFVSKYDTSGNIIWVKSINARGPGTMFLDDSCNIYTAGPFEGTVDFDPGPGVYNVTQSGSIVDVYICKWDSSGNFVWANSLTMAGASYFSDNASSIFSDDSGNVFVTGNIAQRVMLAKFDITGSLTWQKSFGGSNSYGVDLLPDNSGNFLLTGKFTYTDDFDPGAGVFTLNPANGNIFYCKLDGNADLIWAKNFGKAGSLIVNSIAKDSLYNVYFTGFLQDSADFDPGPGIFNVSAPANSCAYVAKYDSSANLIYVKVIPIHGEAYAITVDDDENILITGRIYSSGDFDPGPAVYNVNNALGSVYVSKFDNAGNLIWVTNLPGQNLFTVTTDDAENIYVSGNFSYTRDLDPGPAINLHSSVGLFNTFVSKFNSAGNTEWVFSLTGSEITNNQPAIDAAGNIYTTGSFSGTADFDPDLGITLIDNSGAEDIYIRKVDSSGQFIWAKSIGGPATETGRFIDTDNVGNIYVSGTFNDTADFDPGPSIYNLTAINNLSASNFIASYDSSGNFRWAIQYDNLEIKDMETDGSGNIFLTGYFEYTIDFNAGPAIYNLSTPGSWADIFILKLDANGTFQWAHQIGDPNEDEYGNHVTVDAYGNSYYSGQFYLTVDFDPGPGVYNLIPEDLAPAYILKLDPAGNFIWVKQIYGVNDYDGYVDPPVLKASENGVLFMAGSFKGLADFDPSPALDTVSSVTSAYDIYVSKWTPSGNKVWKKIITCSGSSCDMLATSLSVDYSLNVLVAGTSNEPFSPQIAIAGINNTGSFSFNTVIWGKGKTPFVAHDQYNNSYASGIFETTSDFDLTTGINKINPSGKSAIFLAKYATSFTACSTVPNAIITDAANNTICSGEPVSLTQIGGILNSSGSFQWFLDSCGGVFVGNGPSITVSPSDTSTYFVRIEDSCGVSICNAVTVNVIPSPAAPVISGNTLFCTGDSIILDAGSGFLSYDWSTSDTTQTTYITDSGLYEVIVSGFNGCTSMATVNVSTYPNPPVNIFPASTVLICLGDTVNFTATYNPGYSYQWMRNSIPLPGATNYYFDASSTASYSCVVTDMNSCENETESVKVRIICIPLQDPLEKTSSTLSGNEPAVMNVFYDPGTAIASVNAKYVEGKNYTLNITDVTGKNIYHATGQISAGELEKAINCIAFAENLYLLTLKTEVEFLLVKFIKE